MKVSVCTSSRCDPNNELPFEPSGNIQIAARKKLVFGVFQAAPGNGCTHAARKAGIHDILADDSHAPTAIGKAHYTGRTDVSPLSVHSSRHGHR